MKKITLFLPFLLILLIPTAFSQAAFPSPSDLTDSAKVDYDPFDKLPTSTADAEDENLIIQTIDPKITIPYKPLPLPDPEIIIPPELLLGPQISDVQVAYNDSELLIVWMTNKPATSKVEYGTTSEYEKSLEDKNLVTEHEMTIPAEPGSMHIKINSDDSSGKHSESEDISILIPEPTTAEPPEDVMYQNQETNNENLAIDVMSADEDKDAKPLLEVNGIDAPEKTSTGISTTNALLGGFALLLVGALIGVLVKTKKQ